ncbi:AAA family ATPase [Wolbachia endosymbiont of Spodoptera picta]|uniref:AAA family ATPase n=1 Tax=Wolbachia endosymbiont of Spodoptera picta TaxID=2769078 RepID=UPI001BA7E2F2|nr:AAA family ATPase [Wolbachia endosymbiont of Spodoptera picta]QUI60465.1 AAA family ATPase [Wolbachia endosymbiont of Spodoptera picta]
MEFCITESRQEIKMLLAHNIKECLSYLLPGGKFGYGFYSGNINKDHLMVVAEGKQTGTWYNCDKKTNGDIIELWSIITNKTDFSEITSLITKWLSERIIAKYSYLDKNNEAIAYVYLYKNNYRHIWNLRTSRNGLKPLYNIPGIIKSDEVIIVKGENRADSLIKRGFTATTAIDDDIEKTDWSMLTDKHIIIWPEKDEQYVKKVAVELDNLGMSCENPESLGISSENRESLSVLSEKKAFPASHYLNDKSPSPEDIILPRILTPGGLLLLRGAPKVGKTDLLLSWLAHLSVGLPFLSMVPIRPLKIFYLQTDLEYPYIKERLQQLKFDDKSLELISKNLIITPKTSLLLNSQGVEEVKDIIAERLDVKTVDIIAIDTLRGVFDFNQYKGENSNSSMFCFLKDRVEKLRSITNPSCGIILTHNTNKVSKKSLVEEPFQNFSGASALRSFYTSGIMMIKPNGEQNTRQLIFELRNGKSILPMQIEKVNDSWQTVSEKPTVKQRRKKSYDIILRLINERAAKGKFYTKSQFCYLFEDTFGLKSCHSIRRYVNALVASGYIKFYEKEIPERVKVMKVAEHLTRRDI